MITKGQIRTLRVHKKNMAEMYLKLHKQGDPRAVEFEIEINRIRTFIHRIYNRKRK